jgi:hypothetical protein
MEAESQARRVPQDLAVILFWRSDFAVNSNRPACQTVRSTFSPISNGGYAAGRRDILRINGKV